MKSRPRITLRKIIEAILVGFGIALFMNGAFDALDYGEAAERYHAKAKPLVDAMLIQPNIVNGELHYDTAPLSGEQRSNLHSEFFFIEAKIPRRSISELKYQMWGGWILLGIGSLLSVQRTRKEQREKEERTAETHSIFSDDAPTIRRTSSSTPDSLVSRKLNDEQQHD